MRELIYKKFIIGTGEYLNKALINGIGGIIFFTRDIQSKEQFIDLINNIKSKSKNKLFLSIDQEGGRVERTENICPKRLSARFAFAKGKDFLTKQTEQMAKELREYGINLNFAPCADVNTNPNNPIIGERAFSNKVEEVIQGIEITSKIYRENNITPCIKHYPGHGDADKDSHLTLPCIDLPIEEMQKIHIKPFEHFNNIEMIMAAHLHCTCFDKNIIPASLSKNAIGHLRNKLSYNGVIISDDMIMKGVQAYGSVEACIMGIKAGLDMFIFRDADFQTIETIEKLTIIVEQDEELKNLVLKSNERIEALKSKIN